MCTCIWLKLACKRVVMLSKQKRPYDAESLGPRERLRRNLETLHLNGELSGERLGELCGDINRVDGASFPEVARRRAKVGPADRNTARFFRSRFKKKMSWWPHYWAQVRCINVKTGKEELQWLAFHLPHEIIVVLKALSSEKLMDREGLDPVALRHLLKVEMETLCSMLGVGIWGDECPCNWDRSESVSVLSLSLPGQSDPKFANFRCPITSFGHKQVSPNTWHDIMKVVKWSLQILATGKPPTARHDGTAWLKSDCKRNGTSKNSPKSVQRSCLVEVRADWKFMAEVYNMPSHNLGQGCCWSCTCTPNEVT